MKNLIAALAIVLCEGLLVAPARAQTPADQDDAKIAAITVMKTGNDLLWACTEDSQTEGINVFSSAMCAMYIHGITDLLAEKSEACGDPAVSLEQIRDVVVKFLKDNPAERNNSAASLVEYALKIAFPCGEKLKKGAKR